MRIFFTFLLLVAMGATASSCLKKAGDVGPTSSTSFTGKWRIVNDSTIIQFWGLWSGRPDTGINYPGKAADYYNFLSNGTLYTSENGVLDTATYTIMPHDTITFKYLYPTWLNPASYTVSNHTDHTLTLTSGVFVSPEAASVHIINLEK